MNRLMNSAAALAALGFTVPALAQHDGDVILAMGNLNIVTGVVENGQFEPHFIWIESIDNNITDDPGYEAPSGTFAPSSTAGISIRKALRMWDYENNHFLDIPDESMVITRFSLSIETPPSDPAPGEFPTLLLGVTSGSGAIHVHPWYELTAPASDGMYLLELEFWINPGITPVWVTSNPFWVIFTKNEHDPAVIHEAEEWVLQNLVDPQKCPADLTGDGNVGVPDLLALLGAWGSCPDPGDCPADLTGSGSVGVPDLLTLLSSWGPCP